jgi:hypothetical protein
MALNNTRTHVYACLLAPLQEAERAERAIKDALLHLKEVMKEREPSPPDLNFKVLQPAGSDGLAVC